MPHKRYRDCDANEQQARLDRANAVAADGLPIGTTCVVVSGAIDPETLKPIDVRGTLLGVELVRRPSGALQFEALVSVGGFTDVIRLASITDLKLEGQCDTTPSSPQNERPQGAA